MTPLYLRASKCSTGMGRECSAIVREGKGAMEGDTARDGRCPGGQPSSVSVFALALREGFDFFAALAPST